MSESHKKHSSHLRRFSVRHHVPHYTKILWSAATSPLPIYITIAGNILTFGGAYIFYVFEKADNPKIHNYFDAFWWAMCTVSTVGFGDIVPHTIYGRFTAMALIVSGVFLFVSYTGTVLTIVTELSAEHADDID